MLLFRAIKPLFSALSGPYLCIVSMLARRVPGPPPEDGFDPRARAHFHAQADLAKPWHQRYWVKVG